MKHEAHQPNTKPNPHIALASVEKGGNASKENQAKLLMKNTENDPQFDPHEFFYHIGQNTDQTLTPRQLGWKIGDKFEVVEGDFFNGGETVVFVGSLDTISPHFMGNDGVVFVEYTNKVRPLKQKLTPAQELGYEIGDEFKMIANTSNHRFKIGDIVVLINDDGTAQPKFRKKDGEDMWYYSINSDVKPIKGVEQQTKHNHYFRPCPYDSIDPYRIIDIYGITDPCFQHVLKKVLAPGDRGHKDVAEDVQNIIDTMERWKKMRAEEQALENNND